MDIKQVWHKVRIESIVNVCFLDRKRQIELNIGKTFINAKGMDSAKFGKEMHFVSFAAVVATRNRTQGSNFHN
jgi:hypothetical protein